MSQMQNGFRLLMISCRNAPTGGLQMHAEPGDPLSYMRHGHAEVSRLRISKAGSMLRLTHALPVPIIGQSVMSSHDEKQLFDIARKKREVIVCRSQNVSTGR